MTAARERVTATVEAPPQRAAPPRVNAAAEREAEQAGAAAATGVPTSGWSLSAVPVSAPETGVDARALAAVAGPGRMLDSAAGRALADGVHVHDDARAAASTRAAGAEALAVGEEIALATPHDPRSPRSRALLAHELAHVAQHRAGGATAAVQRDDGAPAAAATTLGALPEADRKQLQIVTAQVTVPGLAEKFATTGTKVTIPPAAPAAFDASVDPSLQHGLGNVAGSLSNGVDITPTPLPPNSTLTLELDVGGTVGKGLYRFTYHAPAAPAGSKTPAPAPRIVIEALGKATAPAGTKAPPEPKEGEAAAPDPVADKIKKHSLSVSYSGTDLDALRAALDQIPDAQLAVVSGLKFRRDTSKPTDPTASGDYDPKTHTVTMYDKAFAGSQVRFKGAGTVTSSGATRAIVHEIGHAIDLAPMRKAGVEKDKADKAVDALPSKYPDPDDPTKYQYKKGSAEEKDVQAILKAQKDAEAALLSARSLSGSKTVKKPGTNPPDFEDVIGTDVKGIKFREAAAKDGGKAVSAYGDQDFQEAFAEAYSLYITSPDTLKALRPNVFAFLDTNLPK